MEQIHGDRFETIRKLGAGTFGEVFECVDRRFVKQQQQQKQNKQPEVSPSSDPMTTSTTSNTNMFYNYNNIDPLSMLIMTTQQTANNNSSNNNISAKLHGEPLYRPTLNSFSQIQPLTYSRSDYYRDHSNNNNNNSHNSSQQQQPEVDFSIVAIKTSQDTFVYRQAMLREALILRQLKGISLLLPASSSTLSSSVTPNVPTNDNVDSLESSPLLNKNAKKHVTSKKHLRKKQQMSTPLSASSSSLLYPRLQQQHQIQHQQPIFPTSPNLVPVTNLMANNPSHSQQHHHHHHQSHPSLLTPQLVTTFDKNERLHLVMELMKGGNLYEFLKNVKKFQPVPVGDIRRCLFRVLHTLSRLHTKLGYIHCDIKLENIMFRSKGCDFDSTCLIDFGSARLEAENRYYDVQSLWYRAPEVLCCVPYSRAVDVWSLGCVAFELLCAAPLVPANSADDALGRITKACGLLPRSMMMTRGSLVDDGDDDDRHHQDEGEDHECDDADCGGDDIKKLQAKQSMMNAPIVSEKYFVRNCNSSTSPTPPPPPMLPHLLQNMKGCPESLKELIMSMLQVDPQRRITVEEALQHDFFSCLRNHSKLLEQSATNNYVLSPSTSTQTSLQSSPILNASSPPSMMMMTTTVGASPPSSSRFYHHQLQREEIEKNNNNDNNDDDDDETDENDELCESEDDGCGVTLDQALLLEIGCTYGDEDDDEVLQVNEDEVHEFHQKMADASSCSFVGAEEGEENNPQNKENHLTMITVTAPPTTTKDDLVRRQVQMQNHHQKELPKRNQQQMQNNNNHHQPLVNDARKIDSKEIASLTKLIESEKKNWNSHHPTTSSSFSASTSKKVDEKQTKNGNNDKNNNNSRRSPSSSASSSSNSDSDDGFSSESLLQKLAQYERDRETEEQLQKSREDNIQGPALPPSMVMRVISVSAPNSNNSASSSSTRVAAGSPNSRIMNESNGFARASSTTSSMNGIAVVAVEQSESPQIRGQQKRNLINNNNNNLATLSLSPSLSSSSPQQTTTLITQMVKTPSSTPSKQQNSVVNLNSLINQSPNNKKQQNDNDNGESKSKRQHQDPNSKHSHNNNSVASPYYTNHLSHDGHDNYDQQLNSFNDNETSSSCDDTTSSQSSPILLQNRFLPPISPGYNLPSSAIHQYNSNSARRSGNQAQKSFNESTSSDVHLLSPFYSSNNNKQNEQLSNLVFSNNNSFAVASIDQTQQHQIHPQLPLGGISSNEITQEQFEIGMEQIYEDRRRRKRVAEEQNNDMHDSNNSVNNNNNIFKSNSHDSNDDINHHHHHAGSSSSDYIVLAPPISINPSLNATANLRDCKNEEELSSSSSDISANKDEHNDDDDIVPSISRKQSENANSAGSSGQNLVSPQISIVIDDNGDDDDDDDDDETLPPPPIPPPSLPETSSDDDDDDEDNAQVKQSKHENSRPRSMSSSRILPPPPDIDDISSSDDDDDNDNSKNDSNAYSDEDIRKTRESINKEDTDHLLRAFDAALGTWTKRNNIPHSTTTKTQDDQIVMVTVVPSQFVNGRLIMNNINNKHHRRKVDQDDDDDGPPPPLPLDSSDDDGAVIDDL